MTENKHFLFTDGSSLGNPGSGGWGAVVVSNGKFIVELGGFSEYTTNNKMELTAVIEGLRHLKGERGDLVIFTDSRYVENGATKWIHGWKKNGWRTAAKLPVENRDIWEELDLLIGDRKQDEIISWKHVPGHAGVLGNERCDEIATNYARKESVVLFSGDIIEYPIDILNIEMNNAQQEKRSQSKIHSKTKAYVYLSNINGVVARHQTWAECEKWVKGKSGARYKKAISPRHEKEILAEWSISR